MSHWFLKTGILSILFAGQAGAKSFVSFSGGSISVSGDSVVIINGKVVSPGQTEYPKSDAPPKVVEHEEVKKTTETYEFDEYHQVQARYPFGENGNVVVENFNGQVEVEPSDVDKICVEITLEPPVLKSPVTATIEVDPVSAYAKIKATYEKQPVFIAAVMKILVPRTTSVQIKTCNGRVSANDREGDTDIYTSNGSIEACNLRGATSLRSSNGSIDAHNVTGAIDFHTGNGKIDAQNIHAVGKLFIKTSNGAIDLGLLSALHIRHADIVTSNGHITLALARTIQAVISGRTSNGSVRGNVWQRWIKKKRAEATLGNGEMSMQVKTSNSSIDANFR